MAKGKLTLTIQPLTSELRISDVQFDNGITLWHTKDVGNYEYRNGERYTADMVDKYGNYKEKKVH